MFENYIILFSNSSAFLSLLNPHPKIIIETSFAHKTIILNFSNIILPLSPAPLITAPYKMHPTFFEYPVALLNGGCMVPGFHALKSDCGG